MSDLIKQVSADIQQKIDAFQPSYALTEVGTVLEAGDGIARVSGLTKIRSQELVQFENGVEGHCFQPGNSTASA